ncbi:MAG TPA: hypothetical protein VJ735_05205 [Actinomycetes bacterium]|nr:hypothetical protein [Actinomycetes bacterium]
MHRQLGHGVKAWLIVEQLQVAVAETPGEVRAANWAMSVDLP